MTHRCTIQWIPAEQKHKIICLDCGELIADSINEELFIEGDCIPDDNTLGVHAKDGIKFEDVFGKR